ncbi:hypothetical protein B0I35DRAFT_130343 [Stachybotrys elegans]|uniref:Secreted protein n=1 Tax=Stachybotrys elegans TaxID=80388 RepID=A0A8K0SW37_9HYPO|nr:hypothetical protein B0I35DRAFT_130343 [Stachybotrys elegans]
MTRSSCLRPFTAYSILLLCIPRIWGGTRRCLQGRRAKHMQKKRSDCSRYIQKEAKTSDLGSAIHPAKKKKKNGP